MGPYVKQLYRYIIELKLDRNNEEIAQLRARIEAGKVSELSAKGWLVRLRDMIQRAIDFPNVLHEPPDEEQLPQADITFATLENDLRYGIRLFDRARHLLATGVTGAGKSSLFRNICILMDKACRKTGRQLSQIIFDRKGGDYADLPRLLGAHWLHLNVHDGLRIGLRAPDSVPPRIWLNIIGSLFASRAGLAFSATAFTGLAMFLSSVLHKTYGRQLAPSMRVLHDALQSSGGAFSGKGDYDRSLDNELKAVIQATDVFETMDGLELNRDVIDQGRSVVIEMPNLAPPWLRQFIVDLLLAQVLLARVHRHHRVSGTEVMVYLDEADQDISVGTNSGLNTDLPMISQVLKTGREFGISCCVGLSEYTQASRYVLNNVSYQLVFAPASAQATLEATRTLLLPPGGDQMLRALKVRECIILEALSEWPHAVLATIDEVPPSRCVPEHYDHLPFTPPPANALSEMPEVQAALATLRSEYLNSQKRHAMQSELSSWARQLLDLAAMYPYEPVARLWDRRGLVSRSVQMKACTELKTHKCAAFTDTRIGKRNVLLIEILEAGWKTVNRAIVAPQGRGGIIHRHFSQWLKALGIKRKYTQSFCEWLVPNTSHHADAAWKINNSWTVFEAIVESQDNLAQHCNACLIQSQAVESVVIVAAQKADVPALQALIANDPELKPVIERIKFETITPYMEELFS